MIINFSIISEIFLNFIKNSEKQIKYSNTLEHLVFLCIKTNKTLWDLEDSARMSELGYEHVSKVKNSIDSNNERRNNLIREIDIEVSKIMDVTLGSSDKFYSESPGMIIDRLSIIFIKLSIIQKLLSVIEENDLKDEYSEK